jgi:ubiquinone biosynthesis protein UbiJ
LEALPRSEEAERLAEEWRRLLDEIARAQDYAEESLREDILPRLRDKLEALKKRLEELQPKKRRPMAPEGIWI